MGSGQSVSFGKLNLKNVRKLKPESYDHDGEWDWENGFTLSIMLANISRLNDMQSLFSELT